MRRATQPSWLERPAGIREYLALWHRESLEDIIDQPSSSASTRTESAKEADEALRG